MCLSQLDRWNILPTSTVNVSDTELYAAVKSAVLNNKVLWANEKLAIWNTAEQCKALQDALAKGTPIPQQSSSNAEFVKEQPVLNNNDQTGQHGPKITPFENNNDLNPKRNSSPDGNVDSSGILNRRKPTMAPTSKTGKFSPAFENLRRGIDQERQTAQTGPKLENSEARQKSSTDRVELSGDTSLNLKAGELHKQKPDDVKNTNKVPQNKKRKATSQKVPERPNDKKKKQVATLVLGTGAIGAAVYIASL